MRKVIQFENFSNGAELLLAVQSLLNSAKILNNQHPETVYVTGTRSIGLIEETLTDGSKVYDIHFTPREDED